MSKTTRPAEVHAESTPPNRATQHPPSRSEPITAATNRAIDEALTAEDQERVRAREQIQRSRVRKCHGTQSLQKLQQVATFASLGAGSAWIDRGESPALFAERARRGSSWREVNDEFCRRWGALWLEATNALRAGGYADVVRRTEPRHHAAKVAKLLFVRMLEAENPESDLNLYVGELARVRERLAERRFRLHHFFEDASASLVQYLRREQPAEPPGQQDAECTGHRPRASGRRPTDAKLDRDVRAILDRSPDDPPNSDVIAAKLLKTVDEIVRSRSRIRARKSRAKKTRARRP
jgi:hypothetical protein